MIRTADPRPARRAATDLLCHPPALLTSAPTETAAHPLPDLNPALPFSCTRTRSFVVVAGLSRLAPRLPSFRSTNTGSDEREPNSRMISFPPDCNFSQFLVGVTVGAHTRRRVPFPALVSPRPGRGWRVAWLLTGIPPCDWCGAACLVQFLTRILIFLSSTSFSIYLSLLLLLLLLHSLLLPPPPSTRRRQAGRLASRRRPGGPSCRSKGCAATPRSSRRETLATATSSTSAAASRSGRCTARASPPTPRRCGEVWRMVGHWPATFAQQRLAAAVAAPPPKARRVLRGRARACPGACLFTAAQAAAPGPQIVAHMSPPRVCLVRGSCALCARSKRPRWGGPPSRRSSPRRASGTVPSPRAASTAACVAPLRARGRRALPSR